MERFLQVATNLSEAPKFFHNAARRFARDLRAPVDYARQRSAQHGWRVAAGEMLSLPVLFAAAVTISTDSLLKGAVAGGLGYYMLGNSLNDYQEE